MRITRMRAAVASVLGMAMIALASPAMAATQPTPSETSAVTTTPSATPSSTPATDPTATPSPDPLANSTASATPSATPGIDPSATPSLDPSATPSIDPGVSVAATVTTPPAGGTGDPTLDGFLDLLPFKVPLDKEIDSIEDMDVNPLFLTFTCTDAGPDWKLKNTAAKAFGFGWFDTNLGGGILEIGPSQTVDIDSKALAVIGSPWDAETKTLLVTVPTVGVSDCEGGAVAPPTVAPAALPIAAPAVASAVSAEPYYTR